MEHKYTILIVEDDQFFRRTIKDLVEQEGFSVKEAPNGSIAKDLIKQEKFSAIISDIQMPEMTGVELLEWTRNIYDRSFRSHQALPFILMTGFAHIIETQKAHDLGVEEFLTKPFGSDELIEALHNVLGIKPESEEEEIKKSDESKNVKQEKPNFCRVSLEDFVTDRDIQMDVYVKLSEKKHIKIAHKGNRIDLERVDSYRKKGLKYLYVRQEDFKKVLDFNIMLSKVVSKSDEVTQAKKRRFVANTAEIIIENVAIVGLDEHSFSEAKDFFLSSFEVLTDDPETLGLLNLMSDHSDHLYVHSLGVSIYSIMIAREMQWKSTASLFKLQFGALMHDIGKKEYPPELLDKPRTQLSYEEKHLLEGHAFRSKEILSSLKSAPSEVVTIAYEHHENTLGQGYPRRLSKNKIHPMSKIVAVADEFCKYALKNPNNPGVTAQKAFHLLNTYKKDELDPDATIALQTLVKKTAA